MQRHSRSHACWSQTHDETLPFEALSVSRGRAFYQVRIPAPLSERVKLSTRTISRGMAHSYVGAFHRHLPTPPAGDFVRFGVFSPDGVCRGVAIAGRPTARLLGGKNLVEVTRVATDGTPNTSSALLGAVVRWARKEGKSAVLTYTLQSEGGASLRGAGFEVDAENIGGGHWDDSRDRSERSGQVAGLKTRWVRGVSS